MTAPAGPGTGPGGRCRSIDPCRGRTGTWPERWPAGSCPARPRSRWRRGTPPAAVAGGLSWHAHVTELECGGLPEERPQSRVPEDLLGGRVSEHLLEGAVQALGRDDL